MAGPGCDECEKNLKAELESKDEKELTDQERAILEGTAEAPAYTGPLSSADVDYCEFCHGVGQLGAILFGSIFGIAAISSFGFGLGLLFGMFIWLVLAVIVGYVGHFPVLGPLFGPIVEKLAASQGYYPTEKAKKEYGSAKMTDGSGGSVENRFPIEGSEMHLLAHPQALEMCWDMSPDAVVRVEIENGQIIDMHNFHPEFNRFKNLHDHVGYFQYNNVCQSHKHSNGPTTTLQFSELLQTQGEGGIK